MTARDELRADSMGLGVQIPESVRPRSDHDILLTIQYTLEKIALDMAHIRSALGNSAERRSSVEIKTSTRGVDITAKAYEGSPIIEAEGEAVSSYFRVMAEVQDRLNGGAK